MFLIHSWSCFSLRKKGDLTPISMCHLWQGGHHAKPMESLCANTTHVTCMQWGNQVTTALYLSCMPICWWQCSVKPRAGMHACEHWRLQGTISCSYMMKKGVCTAVLQSYILQQQKPEGTGQGHQKRKNKSQRRFSRHPALNPCPSYSLPDCLHIP